jgi:cytoskeletal protein CcmA (bactofilin family)
MNMSAGTGQSIRIKGEITAREPFLVAGHIEGTVEVEGHTLTVADGATVDATVSADTVVIQGHVKGEMSAANKIVVQQSAKIEGQLQAPTISVADGATIHGKVETTKAKAKLAAAS